MEFTELSGDQTRYRYDMAGQLVGIERSGLPGCLTAKTGLGS